MIRRIRQSIGLQILAAAAFNLVLLGGIGLVASGVRLPRSLSDVVMQAAEGRLLDVSRRIALDLERTPRAQADALLDRYGQDYRTRFLLVTNDGARVAGVPLQLPADVLTRVLGPPPRQDARSAGGPPRDGRVPFPGGPPERSGVRDGPGLRLPQTPPLLVTTSGGSQRWILIRIPIRFADAAETMPGTLVVVPTSGLTGTLLFPARWFWFGLVALAVTALCWWPLLGGLTRSLGAIEHATGQIAQGRFDAPISIDRPDEIGRLSRSIADMSGRLGALVSGQKRFLGDTAHELRSPLGRMRVALEILATRVPDKERAYVRDLQEDVDALSQLTDDLLQYARSELSDRRGPLEAVHLATVVARVVAREGGATPTFTVSVPDTLQVRADPALFERALANVVRNAVTYAAADGPIEIAAAAEPRGHVTVAVRDVGPGIAVDAMSRIFEPFYREDAARNRKTGGVGLGLAIVRSAIEAGGGTVSCQNRQPRGLEVRLTVPSA